MQLGLPHGPGIELIVLGYEFPRVPIGMNHDDANWLNIAARVSMADGRSWEFTHPCLDTFEADQLLSWLQQLSRDRNPSGVTRNPAPTDNRLEFTEPLLGFEAQTTSIGDTLVRITLDLEALPPGEEVDDQGECVVVISTDRRALSVAASEWAEDLLAFPPR